MASAMVAGIPFFGIPGICLQGAQSGIFAAAETDPGYRSRASPAGSLTAIGDGYVGR
ncbi:MAG: hypothetical protein ACHQKY_15135 [Terriglobia bacterium]